MRGDGLSMLSSADGQLGMGRDVHESTFGQAGILA